MEIIYVMLIVSVLLAGGFLAAFLWSVRSGQYDDSYTPSVRILFEDKEPQKAEEADPPTSQASK